MGGPHDGFETLTSGEPLERARAAMILVHGRGASPEDILSSTASLRQPGLALLGPRAAGGTWYPNPFTAPIEANEPWLSSALEVLDTLLARVELHIPAEQVILLGFSQGACLALEFAARRPRRYGALVGLSGGLIGPDDALHSHSGSLAGSPVLLACAETDPFIPARRVIESSEVLRAMGAEVAVHLIPGLGHQVSAGELALVRELIAALPRRDGLGAATLPAPAEEERR